MDFQYSIDLQPRLPDGQEIRGKWENELELEGDLRKMDITPIVCFVLSKAERVMKYDSKDSIKRGIDYILSTIPLNSSLTNFVRDCRNRHVSPNDQLIYTYIVLNTCDEFKEKKYTQHRTKIKEWLETLLDEDFKKDNFVEAPFILYGLMSAN